MSPKKIIRVDVAEGFRDRVHEAAWKRRTTLSALVRDGLTRYTAQGATRAKLSKSDPGWGTERIKFKIEPEDWEAARERAMADGDSLHSVIRRQLARVCETEGT